MSFPDKCSKCVTNKIFCDNCKDNPKYRNVPKISLYKDCTPVCPLAMTEYIKRMWGDITSEEKENE